MLTKVKRKTLLALVEFLNRNNFETNDIASIWGPILLLGKITAKREDVLQQAETIFQLITENKKHLFELGYGTLEFKETDNKELLKFAKLDDLIDIILMPSIKVSDPKLVDTLLITVPYYTKPHTVMDKMCKKYILYLADLSNSNTSSNVLKWKARWRSNILTFLVSWIGHPKYLHSSQISSKFQKIWKNLFKEAKKLAKKEKLPKNEERSLDSLNILLLQKQKKEEKPSSSSSSDNSPFDLITWDENILAQQITLYDHKWFNVIPIHELLNIAFLDPSKSPNYAKYINHFNNIGFWAGTEIVNRKLLAERANVLSHLINISEKLVSVQNFHSAYGIICGLNMPCILRLKQTWKKVPKKVMSKYEKLMDLFDLSKNHLNYRSCLAQTKGPTIPLMSVISKDLFGIDENNKTIVEDTINVEKMRFVEKIIGHLIECQGLKYSFSKISSVEYYLEKLPFKVEKDIAKESNKCEQRVTPSTKK